MRLTMKQRQAVTAVTVQRYRHGSKKVKRRILDEFCEITGYSRGYARFVLRNHGRQVLLRGKKVIVGDLHKRQQRVKSRYYDEPCTQSETPSFAWRTEDCPLCAAIHLIDLKRGQPTGSQSSVHADAD